MQQLGCIGYSGDEASLGGLQYVPCGVKLRMMTHPYCILIYLSISHPRVFILVHDTCNALYFRYVQDPSLAPIEITMSVSVCM